MWHKMEGEEKMMRKNIWLMLLSIILVIFTVSTSVEAAIGAKSVESETKEESKTESAPVVFVDSGRIGLAKTAKIDSKSVITSTDSVTSISDTKSIIQNDKPDVSIADTPNIENSIDISIETPDEDTPSTPDGNLIWLKVDGDEVSGDDPGTPDAGSNGSLVGSSNNVVNNLPGSPGSPSTEVDEVFITSSSGMVDKVVSIETTLPLNILGYAKVEVLSGSENLVDGPYFDGLDIFDELSLVAASTLIMFLVRAVQILDVVFPIGDAIIISTTICAWMLEKAIYMVENGFSWFSIDITIAGFTLSNPIRTALQKLVSPILEKFVDFLVPIAKNSALDIVNYFQNLKTLFINTDFRALFRQLYSSSSLAVYAILKVLQNKDTSQIKTWLEQFVSPVTAQILVSLLNTYDNLFVSIRDGIFGKFDAFMTYGRKATALRNVHVKVNPNCQVPEGQYAAVIQIKAISAGQVFDDKTIGIIYDGSEGGGVLISGESSSLVTTNSVMGMNSQAQSYNQEVANI